MLPTIAADVETDVEEVKAAIQTETEARVSADAALTSQINTAVSEINSDIGEVKSAIQSEAETRADADEALTNQIETVASAYQAGRQHIRQETAAYLPRYRARRRQGRIKTRHTET